MPGQPDHKQLILEKRFQIYPPLAGLIQELEEAAAAGLRQQVLELYPDLRRLLKSHLAFLTRPVVLQLQTIEQMMQPAESVNLAGLELALKVLHVRLARSLESDDFDGPEQLLEMDDEVREALEASSERDQAVEAARQRAAKVEELQEAAHQAIADERLRKAKRLFKKALELEPGLAVLHNDLAWVLSKRNQTEAALESYRTAVRINEEHPGQRTDEWTSSYYNLGLILDREGDRLDRERQLDEALEAYREARSCFERYLGNTLDGRRRSSAERHLAEIDEEIHLLEEEQRMLSPDRPARDRSRVGEQSSEMLLSTDEDEDPEEEETVVEEEAAPANPEPDEEKKPAIPQPEPELPIEIEAPPSRPPLHSLTPPEGEQSSEDVEAEPEGEGPRKMLE